jgi:DNA-binding MarR family transcriptional regulator
MLELDFFKVFEIQERIRGAHQRSFQENNLPLLTDRLEGYLKVIDSLGSPTLTSLAKTLQLAKPSVTMIANQLVDLGLIEKRRPGEDLRVTTLHLTLLGQRFVQVEQEAMGEFSSQVRSVLSDREADELAYLLAKIISKLG